MGAESMGPSKRTGFLAGALSGLLMTLLLTAFRFIFDTQIITEVMADWLTRVMPARLFDFFLEQLQFNAKRLLFGLIFLGQIGVGGLIGMLYARADADSAYWDKSVQRAMIITVPTWLVLVLAVTPVMGAGLFGTNLLGGAMTYSGALLLAVGAYGFTLTHLLALLGERDSGAQHSQSRREFLRKAGVFSVIVLVGGFALQTILTNLSRLTPAISGRRKGELSTVVTPNDEFYVVAKSAVVPSIDADDWTLHFGGDVTNAVDLTYAELLAMPAVEQYVTLTCISNDVGGDLISNALWKGVPLKLLLERAGLPEGTDRLGFYAADGYFDSFPLDVAMRDEVIVAYQMNGVPLPAEHGFPARIIVPGLYGMEHVKWLVKIEPVASSFRGFWQQRGWADTAVIKTSSRIDIPADRARVPRNLVDVAGVAFAGTRGVLKVEVSTDDGKSWRETDFEPALSPYAWVIWHLDWPEPPLGRSDLLVRATDGTGAVQPRPSKHNLPAGPEGYHEVAFSVTEPSPTPTPDVASTPASA